MGAVLLEELRTFTARLQCAEAASGDPGLGIDLLDAIETLKSVGCAVQAVITDDVATQIRADRKAAGLPRADWDRGIASQIALARRESPNRGGRHLGFARALVHEMPHTLTLLQTGRLNEWRATLLVRETACLSAADRAIVDRRLCSDPAILDGVGDRGLITRAKALAVELDAAAVVARHRKAVSERRVTTRPAPDSMAYLSVLMPVEQAVCLQATLGRDADSLIATGNSGGRTRNQLMVDLLFDRGTGASVASGVPVAVNLVLSDETLLAGGHEAAQLQGLGPVPAAIARQLVADAVDNDTETSRRRVYSCPQSGALTAMESQARTFPKSLRKLIDLRDRTCRTPWCECDAPIRHRDHIRSRRESGATTADNGSGLCEACNYAKEAPGWTARPVHNPGRTHLIDLRTPTGHHYRSAAPPLPSAARQSEVEAVLIARLRAS
ncbi:HNH endonuclease signature motif containing protein [Rhodococcus sp. ACPA1]|uniref:HNH endonuclease signature motif containing protein n=1 Tax=Rhodococcus sp. ACPA1 TaxID=2028572 RepID=UPI000BB1521D|nr:HNH endonuclease signature motif containing protein [Rhodococcus sp. ACPA1]PBC56917.1 HNH endonuclease [Rhodococcus sp. ACPA1]